MILPAALNNALQSGTGSGGGDTYENVFVDMGLSLVDMDESIKLVDTVEKITIVDEAN